MANYFDRYDQQGDAPAPQGGNYYDRFDTAEGAPAAPRGAIDLLLGQTGPRYQTWPEKVLRAIGAGLASGATLPGDVLSGQAKLPSSGVVPGSVPFGDQESAGLRAADLATMASPMNPAIRLGDAALPAGRMVPGPYTMQSVERGAGVPPTIEMAPSQVYQPKLNLRPDRSAIPTSDDLLKAGGRQMDQAAESGVEFTPQAVRELSQQLEAHLIKNKAVEEFAPETYGIIRKLANPPDGAVSSSFGNLKTLREVLGEAAKSTDSRERRAASIAIEKLDEWLGTPSASNLMAGTTPAQGAAAAELYKTGRGNYAAGRRSEDITGRAEAADLRAAAANSGRNVDNATRQRFVDILTSEKAGRGYTDEVLAEVERLVRGTRGMNAARYVGNLFGGGGGMGQAVPAGIGAGLGAAVGTAVGSPVAGAVIGGGTPATIGALAKSLSNTLTKRQVEAIDELIRSRSPLFQQQPEIPVGLLSRELLGPTAITRGGILDLNRR